MSQKNSTSDQTVVTDYVSQYNSATGKGKVAVRTALQSAINSAVMDGDLVTAQAYIAMGKDIDAMAGAAKAPAITRDVLIARRIAELNAAVTALMSDADFNADATTGDGWEVDAKRVDALTTVRSTTKAATYRGATADFVGQVAHAIGAGTFTVSDYIKSGFAAGVTHPTGNKAPHGAVGAWMEKRRDETVDFDGTTVTITRNSDGVAVLTVA